MMYIHALWLLLRRSFIFNICTATAGAICALVYLTFFPITYEVIFGMENAFYLGVAGKHAVPIIDVEEFRVLLFQPAILEELADSVGLDVYDDHVYVYAVHKGNERFFDVRVQTSSKTKLEELKYSVIAYIKAQGRNRFNRYMSFYADVQISQPYAVHDSHYVLKRNAWIVYVLISFVTGFLVGFILYVLRERMKMI